MRKNEDCEENCKKYELAKNGKIIPEYYKRCVEVMCDGSSRVDKPDYEACVEDCKKTAGKDGYYGECVAYECDNLRP